MVVNLENCNWMVWYGITFVFTLLVHAYMHNILVCCPRDRNTVSRSRHSLQILTSLQVVNTRL